MMTGVDGKPIPIRIGENMRDVSGAIVQVTGATLDPVTGKVVPVTLPGGTDAALVTADARLKVQRQKVVLDEEASRRAQYEGNTATLVAELQRKRDELAKRLAAAMSSQTILDPSVIRELQASAKSLREQQEALEREARIERQSREELIATKGAALGENAKADIIDLDRKELDLAKDLLDSSDQSVQAMLQFVDNLKMAEKTYNERLQAGLREHKPDAEASALSSYTQDLAQLRRQLNEDVPATSEEMRKVMAELEAVREQSRAAFKVFGSEADRNLRQTLANITERATMPGPAGMGRENTISDDIQRILAAAVWSRCPWNGGRHAYRCRRCSCRCGRRCCCWCRGCKRAAAQPAVDIQALLDAAAKQQAEVAAAEIERLRSRVKQLETDGEQAKAKVEAELQDRVAATMKEREASLIEAQLTEKQRAELESRVRDQQQKLERDFRRRCSDRSTWCKSSIDAPWSASSATRG